MKRNLKYRMTGLLAACLVFAAAAYGRDGKHAAYRDGERLRVEFTLGDGAQTVTANERLTVTPVIENGSDRLELAPVVFTGRIRRKVDERREWLYGTPAVPDDVFSEVVVHRNRRDASQNAVVYTGDVPYEPWMSGGRLVLYRDLAGCAGHSVSLAPLVAAEIALPVEPRLTFLLPDDEPVKQRSEQITAVVHFPQGRSVLLRGFADNRRQLARIDSLTARLKDNDSLSVENVYLKGYASPEDTYAYNTRLSANRVKAIRGYLQEKFGFADADFTTATEPEDWDSLRRWVVVSDLPARDELLAIIDTIPDPDARDAFIRRIDGGKTYRKLLEEAYPQLRRVDYRIGYVLPAFTEEQARRLIVTRPEWLSLAEMCRVAESYPVDSPERAYACAVASEYYPDDPCACNNMAMLALRRGDLQLAHECLSRCPDDVRVLNNLGVLCLCDGDAEKARHCFTLAARNGSAEAAYNLAHFPDLETDR